MEKEMDKVWPNVKSRSRENGVLTDILHGSVIHDLEGPDGAPFAEFPDGEG